MEVKVPAWAGPKDTIALTIHIYPVGVSGFVASGYFLYQEPIAKTLYVQQGVPVAFAPTIILGVLFIVYGLAYL